jgi:hypothetical protein
MTGDVRTRWLAMTRFVCLATGYILFRIIGKIKSYATAAHGKGQLNRLPNLDLQRIRFLHGKWAPTTRRGLQNRATDLPGGQISLSRMHHIACARTAPRLTAHPILSQ